MRHTVGQEVGMFLGKASGEYNSTSFALHPLVLLLMELKCEKQKPKRFVHQLLQQGSATTTNLIKNDQCAINFFHQFQSLPST